MDDMDEGLIKLANHKDHPTNKAYKVYFFTKGFNPIISKIYL